MSEVDQIERITQNRVVKLLRDQLKYRYLGNWEKRYNRNIEETMLRDFLKKKGINNDLINRAVSELQRGWQPVQEHLRHQQRGLWSAALWSQCQDRGRRKN